MQSNVIYTCIQVLHALKYNFLNKINVQVFSKETFSDDTPVSDSGSI